MHPLCRIALLAVLLLGASSGQPLYTAEGLVSSASGQATRLAPNTHATLYGARFIGQTPLRVIVNNVTAVITYRDANQINFILPPGPPGTREMWLFEGSLTYPRIRFTLLPEAPEFFTSPDGFVTATHPAGERITEQQPARPGQWVILYGTGFGLTRDGQAATNAPAQRADPLVTPIEVWLDGQRLPADQIYYAGITPGYQALYQINLRIPPNVVADPFIQIGFRGEPSSRTGVKVMVRPEP